MGEPFDENQWDKVMSNTLIPEYFLDIESIVREPPLLRGEIPTDSHLLEQDKTEQEEDQEDDDELDLDNDFVTKLNTLHEFSRLGSPNITINDVPGLFATLQENNLSNDADELANFEQNVIPPEPQNENMEVGTMNALPRPLPLINPSHAEISISNILPEGQRRVRFNLPQITRT